jgi:hypothetical protein
MAADSSGKVWAVGDRLPSPEISLALICMQWLPQLAIFSLLVVVAHSSGLYGEVGMHVGQLQFLTRLTCSPLHPQW